MRTERNPNRSLAFLCRDAARPAARTLAVATVALFAGLGCAETLRPVGGDAGRADAGAPTDGIPPVSGAFTHRVDDGVVTTIVDATDSAAWQHLDLDRGLSVRPDEGWELAFSRFRVRINGGVSGSGGVRVAALEGRAFEDVGRAPDAGWTVPVPDGDGDDDEEPDNVFNDGEGDWYDYDVTTHTLTARQPLTYVVATTEGAFFKLAFESYYDDAGSPAVVSFRWAAVGAPDGGLPDAGPPVEVDAGMPEPDAGRDPLPAHAIHVDASDPTAWVYLSVDDGVVSPADPDTDVGWDLALRRTGVRTSSGTSGPGMGGARLDASGLAFDDLLEAPTLGYAADELVDGGRPGAPPSSANPVLAGWFDYDPVGHIVTPGDRTYLVRTADGGYAKLRVWRWDDGAYDLSLLPVERAVEVVELEVDASDREAWVYVSLRDGQVIEVDDPATDRSWDLGLSRTRLRTNGGTSGSGAGEAVETEVAEVGLLDVPPEEGWAVDESLSSGRPGTDPYDASPVLAGWFDYDPVTHTVSPRPVTFVVRTADGHLAGLRVSSYMDGIYVLELAFAGPGQEGFSR